MVAVNSIHAPIPTLGPHRLARAAANLRLCGDIGCLAFSLPNLSATSPDRMVAAVRNYRSADGQRCDDHSDCIRN